jgi:hypothetical protein
MGDIAATPWPFNPAWFLLLSVLAPAIAWLACAWKRALDEDPHRIRRSGLKELRRLLKGIRTVPQPWHLHSWFRAAAKTWDVRASAPTSQEICSASHAFTRDAALTSRWAELCSATERGLFAANAAPPKDWLQRAASAANEVQIPKRERWFPNRMGHWLPSLAAVAITFGCFAAHADAPSKALQALRSNWNDWAAHHNVAVESLEAEDWNAAVAHAAAAFLLHPASTVNRASVRFALEQAGTADPNLRRLLFGVWYQRVPGLLSPAGWQRLTLAACLLIAAALTVMVISLYRADRRLKWASHSALAIGALLCALAVLGWKAYGPLSEPSAGILLQAVNLSPAPTDLVPEEETSPVAAGTVVISQRSFLGWQQITYGNGVSGWIRRNAVMPFYNRSLTGKSHSRRDRTS